MNSLDILHWLDTVLMESVLEEKIISGKATVTKENDIYWTELNEDNPSYSTSVVVALLRYLIKWFFFIVIILQEGQHFHLDFLLFEQQVIKLLRLASVDYY